MVDVSAFAGARTTAADTAVPGVSYGQIVFKKPATPEQIAEAKKAYLADNRDLEDARLRMEKVDDATVSAVLAAFFAVMTVVAMAGLWELVEWQYAVIDGGDAGAAFLGSQGDEWDAQKDILCDALGSACAGALFLLRAKKPRRRK